MVDKLVPALEHDGQYRIGDGRMPRDAKPKKPPSRSGPRTSAGKKQILVIMDAGMAEDGTAASHLVEELVRDWLGDEEGPEVTICGPLAFSGTLWGNCHCVLVIVLVRGCNAWDDSAELKTEMGQVAEAAAGEIDAIG